MGLKELRELRDSGGSKTSGGNWVDKTFQTVRGYFNPAGVQNEGNLELSKYAYSKDLEMWNRQNAYNSPAAQMQRYQDAGLNPNLIYGSGGQSAGNAGSMPQYKTQPYQADPIQGIQGMLGALNMYQELKLKQAQTSNTGNVSAINHAEAQVRSDILREKIQNMWQDGTISHAKATELWQQLESVWGISPGYTQRRPTATLIPANEEMQSMYRNSRKKELLKHSADYEGIELSNDIKRLTRNWFQFNQLTRGLGKLIPSFPKFK